MTKTISGNGLGIKLHHRFIFTDNNTVYVQREHLHALVHARSSISCGPAREVMHEQHYSRSSTTNDNDANLHAAHCPQSSVLIQPIHLPQRS